MRGTVIAHDLGEHAFQIKSEVTGKISLSFYEDSDSDTYIVGYITFYDDGTFYIQHCTTDGEIFTGILPSEPEKIWTITKSTSGITIECNDVQLAEVDYGTVHNSYSSCESKWSGNVRSVMFDSTYDTASSEYRQKPEGT